MSSPADAGRRRIPDSDGMTYIISTSTRSDEETYRKVNELVDVQPDGLVALYAGAGGEGLAITAVWESKAQADRFTAEQLVPALQQLGVHRGGPSSIIEFETFQGAR
jgi:hypothetical protein